MLRSWTSVPAAVLIIALAGCDAGPHSAAGFRLPSSGDVERGKSAFVAHRCHNCHSVDGVELPSEKPESAVALGGAVPLQITDGYLATSIMNPSHVVAGYARPRAATVTMPDFSDDLTLRELTDLVAFLQSRYTVQDAPRYPAVL